MLKTTRTGSWSSSCAVAVAGAGGRDPGRRQHRRSGRARRATAAAAAVAVAPPDYVIGPDDVLSIVFWRDKDMSADVAVRPDGKISLPLLNDVQAAGLTPPQLRERLDEEAKRYRRGPERHGRRAADQQPQGVRHRRGAQARPVSPDRRRRRCCR